MQDWQYVKGWHEQVVEQAPHLKQYLEAHLPSYEAFKAHSLTA